jgi:hypothetical protein
VSEGAGWEMKNEWEIMRNGVTGSACTYQFPLPSHVPLSEIHSFPQRT